MLGTFFSVEILLIDWGYLSGFTSHFLSSYAYFAIFVSFQISNVNEKFCLLFEKIMEYGSFVVIWLCNFFFYYLLFI